MHLFMRLIIIFILTKKIEFCYLIFAYEKIREKHPDSLILLYDKPGCDYDPCPEREEIIFSTYEKALKLGDNRGCYILARELLGETDRDSCMADGAHPTDLEAMRIADSIYSAVGKFF